MAENQLFPDEPGETGQVIPLRRDPEGNLHMAWPGMVKQYGNALQQMVEAPGKAWNGELSADQMQKIGAQAGGLVAMDAGSGLLTGLQPSPSKLGIFAGINAKTANMQKLAQALTHEGRGLGVKEIWDQTGWFRGPDRKWRFEIPDSGAKLSNLPINGQNRTLAKTVDNSAVYDAYPQLKSMSVDMDALRGAGAYFPSSRSISLGLDSDKNLLSTALHEKQHAIQDIEGFARGGDPDEFLSASHFNRQAMLEHNWNTIADKAQELGVDPDNVMKGFQKFASGLPLGNTAYDLKLLGNSNPKLLETFRQHYNTGAQLQAEKKQAMNSYDNLAGEVEARNVQERHTHGYGAETPPWETPGITPLNKQIVKMPGGEEAQLSTVDHDPFNSAALTPIEHDPWLTTAQPINHDPFETQKDATK